jgi:hypothetical protein
VDGAAATAVLSAAAAGGVAVGRACPVRRAAAVCGERWRRSLQWSCSAAGVDYDAHGGVACREVPRWLLLSEGRCCSWRDCVLFIACNWALRVVAACVGVTADMMQRAAQSKLNMVDALVTTYLRNSVHAGGWMQGRVACVGPTSTLPVSLTDRSLPCIASACCVALRLCLLGAVVRWRDIMRYSEAGGREREEEREGHTHTHTHTHKHTHTQTHKHTRARALTSAVLA